MKAAIAYDGWVEKRLGRYSLDGKVVTAGFHKASDFQKIRESMIASEYNLDEVQIRLLNGDEEEKLEEIKGDILQAGQVKEKIGKGYRYPVIGRMLGLDTKIRGDRRKLLSMAGY